MDQIDRVVRRLQDHFRKVTVGRPASEKVIRTLQEKVPGVPGEAIAFWRRVNGIRVRIERGNACEGRIYSVKEALGLYPLGQEDHELARLLPVRSDGCGDYDCLVTGEGIGQGAVVF